MTRFHLALVSCDVHLLHSLTNSTFLLNTRLAYFPFYFIQTRHFSLFMIQRFSQTHLSTNPTFLQKPVTANIGFLISPVKLAAI